MAYLSRRYLQSTLSSGESKVDTHGQVSTRIKAFQPRHSPSTWSSRSRHRLSRPRSHTCLLSPSESTPRSWGVVATCVHSGGVLGARLRFLDDSDCWLMDSSDKLAVLTRSRASRLSLLSALVVSSPLLSYATDFGDCSLTRVNKIWSALARFSSVSVLGLVSTLVHSCCLKNSHKKPTQNKNLFSSRAPSFFVSAGSVRYCCS
ncbi:hypothetical protein BD413DRAFT_64937 [Trametes elegans]|nr:hypothetical protein BD413DRAFT_64937 [Trametes elegans]